MVENPSREGRCGNSDAATKPVAFKLFVLDRPVDRFLAKPNLIGGFVDG
jgi:hypothetical protein